MIFFRNREIKHFSLILATICGLFSFIGFMMSINTGIFALIICIVLCSIFYIFTKKRYKDLELLCDHIDVVLHGNDVFDINTFNESELAILQNEIRKMTIRLRENADALKKDKIYLSDSIADIAHQIRTPLTSVNMIVSFLSKSDLEKERRLVLVSELNSLLSRVDWLITTLLKISKIDAGTVKFKNETIHVKTLIEKSIEPLIIPLEIRNIDLSVDADENITFSGDLNWCAEALGNMIKNCIEHCEENGKIKIKVSDNAIYMQIKITDNGIGLDEKDIPHLFERFYHGSHANKNSFGIGLSLCQMIISQQKGTVKAENVSSGGACFTIKFYKGII